MSVGGLSRQGNGRCRGPSLHISRRRDRGPGRGAGPRQRHRNCWHRPSRARYWTAPGREEGELRLVARPPAPADRFREEHRRLRAPWAMVRLRSPNAAIIAARVLQRAAKQAALGPQHPGRTRWLRRRRAGGCNRQTVPRFPVASAISALTALILGVPSLSLEEPSRVRRKTRAPIAAIDTSDSPLAGGLGRREHARERLRQDEQGSLWVAGLSTSTSASSSRPSSPTSATEQGGRSWKARSAARSFSPTVAVAAAALGLPRDGTAAGVAQSCTIPAPSPLPRRSVARDT